MVDAIGAIGSSSISSETQSLKKASGGTGGASKSGGSSKSSTSSTVTESDLENLTLDEIKSKLQQAVKNGTMTQAESDILLAKMQAQLEKAEQTQETESGEAASKGVKTRSFGEAENVGGFYSPDGAPRGKGAPPELQAVADKLGMSMDEFGFAVRSGKTLEEIAKDKGVSVQDLNDAAAESAKTHLDQAVKDGWLDQSTANLVVSTIRQGTGLEDLIAGIDREA